MPQEDTHKHLAYYRMTPGNVLKYLEAQESGLTSAEAADRLSRDGPNTLTIQKSETWLTTYLRQFKDLMIALLLVSSIISFFLGDNRAGIVLLGLVFFNTTIGFLQEYKAEKLIQSLERLIVAKTRVIRDGVEIEIASSELVAGDIVRIEAGDNVPADLRIIREEELSTNDFALTGESNPTRKFKHAISSDVPLSG